MSQSPALRAHGVVKSYGPRRVVDHVDLSAERGHITAVLGPNGAGKTTMIECCAGLRTPDAGRITVLGLDRLSPSSATELRARVGVMVQEGGLPMAPSAGAVLTHVAHLHGAPERAARVAEQLSLTDSLSTPVRRLSGGQRQRLAVGCAMVGQPDLMFLDEPSSGVDPHSRREMWRLLDAERERGAALVVTTHLMDEAEALADHIVVIDRGRVVAAGTVSDLTSGTFVEIDAQVSAIDAEGLAGLIDAQRPSATHAGAPDRPLTLEAGDLTARDLHRLTSRLLELGLDDASLTVKPRTLENVFLRLTREGADGGEAAQPTQPRRGRRRGFARLRARTGNGETS
ncbi:MAG: ABC transporter ATP-binding protein [Bowdeniella nasicola]|nr:ABC transporter ATP-binding protein [Bowdeniella nasicola]